VFSVLRRVPLPRRITGALEAESGLNDAPTVLLVTLVSTGAALDHGCWASRDRRLRAG
jgi:cell volume regulation protein A